MAITRLGLAGISRGIYGLFGGKVVSEVSKIEFSTKQRSIEIESKQRSIEFLFKQREITLQ